MTPEQCAKCGKFLDMPYELNDEYVCLACYSCAGDWIYETMKDRRSQ